MLPLTLKQLETFVAVAEARGFRRASERLNLSQSAVTAHVQQLEATLGQALFHRTTRSVRLTDAGAQLLERARRVLLGVEDTLRDFRAEAAVERGRVAIACAPSFAASRLPAVLAEFERRHPDVFVQVRELYAKEILEALRADAADFGIGPLPRTAPEFDSRVLFRDGFCAVVARDHPLATRRQVAVAEIVDEPILAMPGSSETRGLVEEAFATAGRQLRPKYEMLHHQNLVAMAAAGLGIAVIPETALAGHDGAGEGYRVLRLTKPDIRRTIGIITLKGHRASPAATAFTTVLAELTQSKGAAYSAA